MIPEAEALVAAAQGVGSVGTWSIALGSVVSGVLLFRQWLSRNARDRAGDTAAIEMIERLERQLTAANERADRYAAERNDLARKVGRLEGEITALQREVRHLTAQMEQMQRAAGIPSAEGNTP
ncbi:hypothetical protein [Coralloluteibacterium thermophilus]|uniref:Chemotaxis protein n=1 Tax=Coralloluteibacterium thermophilum TaxID=2707049 RepID=A0ABV9NKH0_9GAMM